MLQRFDFCLFLFLNDKLGMDGCHQKCISFSSIRQVSDRLTFAFDKCFDRDSGKHNGRTKPLTFSECVVIDDYREQHREQFAS